MVISVSWSDCLQPRDRAEARRTVFLLTAVGGLVTIVLAVLVPQSAGGAGTAFGVVVPVALVLVVAGWLLTRSSGEAPTAWAIFPFATVLVLGGLDILTRDASIAAFVFLFFPVLYAGFQLPRLGAGLIVVTEVAAVVAVALTCLSAEQALVAVVSVPAFLVTSVGVLVYANERRAALLELLRQQAAIDPLTGLATRRVLDQSAQSVLRSASEDAGTALLLIDVDHFKSVNDQYGHIMGDEVLVRVAAVLTRCARPEAVVSRMGGDELAVLVPACPLREAHALGDELCLQVRGESFTVPAGLPPLRVTVSIGAAHAPTQANDLRSLYAAADAALYHAKRAGRDQAAVLPGITNEHEPSRSGGRRRGTEHGQVA